MDRAAFNVRTVQLESGQITTDVTNRFIFISISVVHRDQILRILFQNGDGALAGIKLLVIFLIFHAIAERDVPASCWGPVKWGVESGGFFIPGIKRLIVRGSDQRLLIAGLLIKLDGHIAAPKFVF